MQVKPQPMEHDGQTFASVKEFAYHYGLNYQKVLYYRKRGKSPGEIIDACRFSNASKSSEAPKASSKRFMFEYDGVKYNSLNEAANALGFSPNQIYEIRKRKNLSPAAAIAYAVEKRKKEGKGPAWAAKKCVIDGKEYESQEAAARAYHVPIITVYSRMERDGISFEEALAGGRRASIYRPPVVSLLPNLRLMPITGALNQAVLEDISNSLVYYNCTVSHVRDIVSWMPALLVDGHTYLYFNGDAKGLEIVSELPFSIDDNALNLLNGAYVAVKLFKNPTGALFLFSFQQAKEEGQDIKSLLNAYFSFAAIREGLMRKFGEQDGVSTVQALPILTLGESGNGQQKKIAEDIPAGGHGNSDEMV